MAVSFNTSAEYYGIWNETFETWEKSRNRLIIHYPAREIAERHIEELGKRRHSIKTFSQEVDSMFGIWVIPSNQWLMTHNYTRLYSAPAKGLAEAYIKQVMKKNIQDYEVRDFNASQ